jgi:hypothetical protein
MAEAFDWLKPAPLWQADGLDFRQPDFFRPQVLEFRSDAFMEDFLAAVSSPKPGALLAFLATPPQPERPLKLFQPVHGCFYVVCGSLCCRLPGFPDREVQVAEGESTVFVLRKLVDGAEYAWVVNDTKKGWLPLNGQPKRLLPGEERQPLLRTATADGRTVVFGYIPVASRETYAVPPTELAEDATVPDLRIEELKARFVNPLTEPLSTVSADTVLDAADKVTPPQSLTLSVYLLLDLWEFLFAHVPDVAIALRDNPSATFSGDQAQAKNSLVAFLQAQQLGGNLKLAGALMEVAKKRDNLNQPGGGDLAQLGFTENYNLKARRLSRATLEQLTRRMQEALPTTQPTGIELPKLEPRADTLYVLRCVYERPQCDPPVHIVSQPSVPFQLAPFFDPDAPARPVRIPLPADVSIAGLRKFKKNVAFLMSNAMRKKVASITGKEKALIKEDNPNISEPADDGLAHICSFSIHIIFIVAFFLLITFVVILNFVFWWIAFFKICLPIPKRLLPGASDE